MYALLCMLNAILIACCIKRKKKLNLLYGSSKPSDPNMFAIWLNNVTEDLLRAPFPIRVNKTKRKENICLDCSIRDFSRRLLVLAWVKKKKIRENRISRS